MQQKYDAWLLKHNIGFQDTMKVAYKKAVQRYIEIVLSAELPKAAESSQPRFQRPSRGVDKLDGGDTCSDDVGVAAAHVPWRRALVSGNEIAGSHPGRVAKGEKSPRFDEGA